MKHKEGRESVPKRSFSCRHINTSYFLLLHAHISFPLCICICIPLCICICICISCRHINTSYILLLHISVDLFPISDCNINVRGSFLRSHFLIILFVSEKYILEFFFVPHGGLTGYLGNIIFRFVEPLQPLSALLTTQRQSGSSSKIKTSEWLFHKMATSPIRSLFLLFTTVGPRPEQNIFCQHLSWQRRGNTFGPKMGSSDKSLRRVPKAETV